jgi:hypothetical protein
VGARFGDEQATVAQALEEAARKASLIARRKDVRDPGLRYFLAILLNAPSRSHALRLAADFDPGTRPDETLVRWLEGLARVTVKLQAGGAPWEPNLFGLPQVDAESLEALRAALRGEPAASPVNLAFFDAVRRSRWFTPLFREG